MHIHRTIGMAEAAGFAAIEIEDQLMPKRAHHHVGIEHMIPLELMAAKVREAVAARRDPDFLIIARTNAMRASNFDDALRRGEAYRRGRRGPAVAVDGAHARAAARDRRATGRSADVPGRPRRPRRPGAHARRAGRPGLSPGRRPDDAVLAAYAAWRQVYRDLADGFGANAKPNPEWSDVEKDMLGVIGLEDLLEIERRTVELGTPS